MSVHIRLEVKDDLDAFEAEHGGKAGDDAFETSTVGDAPPPPIVIELVKQATLGRGEDDRLGTQDFDPQSEASFNQAMAEVTNLHIDLASFHAHNRGVSRRHARVQLNNTRLSVTDLGSTNGTYVNNDRLEPNVAYPIKEGDELRLGFMTLILTIL